MSAHAVVDVARLLEALLWWGAWGPHAMGLRFEEAVRHRAPSVDGDTPEAAAEQLRAHLAPLPAVEQRRFVYEVARETFGGEPPLVWNEATAIALGAYRYVGPWMAPTDGALNALFLEHDDELWIVLAHAACAAGADALRHPARRARMALQSRRWPIERAAREAFVELLAGDAEQTAKVRELLLGSETAAGGAR